jgi:hypothetical protein
MPAARMLPALSMPESRSSATARRLVVAWQHPGTRAIQPVAFLSYDGHLYRFAYIRNALSVDGFRPLLGFDDLYVEYCSEQLFSLFAQRAMDARRPDYGRYVASLGLEGEEPEPWEQIARSQGRRRGDTLQFLPEPEVIGDTLSYLFLVNGVRHVHEEALYPDGRELRVTREDVESTLASLTAGAALNLVHEPLNEKNPRAIIVAGPRAIPVGWVPDLLVEDMHRLMASAEVSVTADHINGSDAPSHMRLLARLTARPAAGFRFFTGSKWEELAAPPGQ